MSILHGIVHGVVRCALFGVLLLALWWLMPRVDKFWDAHARVRHLKKKRRCLRQRRTTDMGYYFGRTLSETECAEELEAISGQLAKLQPRPLRSVLITACMVVLTVVVAIGFLVVLAVTSPD